jgi:hypothetical protein
LTTTAKFVGSGNLISSAKFSDDRRYRYWLLRCWDPDGTTLAIIGLNPSTADEEKNDPTVSRCIERAKRLGFGRLLMLNMYAFRATYPRDLLAAFRGGIDIVTAPNMTFNLHAYCAEFQVTRTIAAWGKGLPIPLQRERQRFFELAGEGSYSWRGDWHLDCFRKNLDGSPAHPLYLPYSLTPQPWNYQP